jgi:hypothetical protein
LLGKLGARLGRRLQQLQQQRVHALLDLAVVASLVTHAGEDSMATAAWLKGLKDLSKGILSHTDFDALWAEIIAERNDRGAALIAGTLVENVLRRAIMRRLVPLTQGEVDSLFGRDAPLSTFSDLIRIAHAFGLIPKEIKLDLDRLREIRNAFAHTYFPVNFETEVIVKACMGFAPDPAPYADVAGMTVAKSRYLNAVGRLIVSIGNMPEGAHAPIPYASAPASS